MWELTEFVGTYCFMWELAEFVGTYCVQWKLTVFGGNLPCSVGTYCIRWELTVFGGNFLLKLAAVLSQRVKERLQKACRQDRGLYIGSHKWSK